MPDSKTWHRFCTLKDIASKPCGSEIWTFGYLTEVNLADGMIVLSFESVNVNVLISMLESSSYQKGGLYTCLAYVERCSVLLAKVLKLSDGLNTDLLVRVASKSHS